MHIKHVRGVACDWGERDGSKRISKSETQAEGTKRERSKGPGVKMRECHTLPRVRGKRKVGRSQGSRRWVLGVDRVSCCECCLVPSTGVPSTLAPRMTRPQLRPFSRLRCKTRQLHTLHVLYTPRRSGQSRPFVPTSHHRPAVLPRAPWAGPYLPTWQGHRTLAVRLLTRWSRAKTSELACSEQFSSLFLEFRNNSNPTWAEESVF